MIEAGQGEVKRQQNPFSYKNLNLTSSLSTNLSSIFTHVELDDI